MKERKLILIKHYFGLPTQPHFFKTTAFLNLTLYFLGKRGYPWNIFI